MKKTLKTKIFELKDFDILTEERLTQEEIKAITEEAALELKAVNPLEESHEHP